MPYANLRPSQVILDPENPRLPDGTTSDREAINRLLDDGAEALISLARDMAQTGQTNPAELPIAIKQGSKYLILEGNRRFAALKLMKDPALAYSSDHQQAFRRAAALGSPPKSVFTLVTVSREEADHWIVLRHTGENNGRGVKRWSAGQTATHRTRANRTIDSGTVRSITIADELEEVYASDQQLVELIRRTRREKLTNIGRFFSPDILSRLQLSIHVDRSNLLRERTLWARHTPEQLHEFFRWAIEYIYSNSVDAYKNAPVRSRMIDEHALHLVPDVSIALLSPARLTGGDADLLVDAEDIDHPNAGITDSESLDADLTSARDFNALAHSDSNSPLDRGAVSPDSDARPDTDRTRVSRRETKPERYLLQELRLPNHDERIQRLVREARGLELRDVPGVAAVMVRVIVELSVSSARALSLSGAREGDSLRDKILQMIRYLDPQADNPRKADPVLAQAYLEASELGVRYLNAFVHSPTVQPDEHLARRFSGAFRPLLRRIDEAL